MIQKLHHSKNKYLENQKEQKDGIRGITLLQDRNHQIQSLL